MDMNISSFNVVLAPKSGGHSNLPQICSYISSPMDWALPFCHNSSLRSNYQSPARLSSSHGELQGKSLLSTITNAFFPSPRSQPKDHIQHPMPDQPKKDLPLPERWREIQGEKHWEGLLEHPIDATLRAEIIRYGEFAQVCYDAFDFNEHSLYCGSCKYSRRALFEKVDKGKCGYEVTKYLYATSKLDLPKFFRRSGREEEKRWSRDSNWIGYVAVCVDEEEIRRIGRRDIVIAWRGTVTKTEWAEDLRALQTPANVEQKDGAAKISALAARAGADGPRGSQSARNGENLSEIVKVESGFLSLYSSSKPTSRFNKLSAGQQMAMEVKRLLQKYEEEEVSITITGHSLGAALALLCAYDIAANVTPSLNLAASASPTTAAGSDPRVAAPVSGCGDASPTPTTNMAESLDLAAKSAGVMITVFAFAGPRVGNRAWQRRMADVGVRVLRLVNVHDCVPKVPGFLFNERWAADAPSIKVLSGYHHVGKELLIDFDCSPHLRRTSDLSSHHNLEAYLHILDGFHGFNCPFQSLFGRNPVLVNKSSDFLIKDSHIPPSWWQESNKGLVKDPSSGQWILASREEDHLPETHIE